MSIDTLRADHLGCYGYKGGRTPVLDALADAGILFEDVTATAPITAPSHASILTGLYPPGHGVRSNGLYELAPDQTTLAEVLESAGFDTAAVIGGFPLGSRYGFAQGFRRFSETFDIGEEGEGERDAAGVSGEAIRTVTGWKKSGRNFLFVHFYDPHADYRPPEDFRGLPSLYDGEIAFVDREFGKLLDALDRSGLAGETIVALVADHGESLGEHGEKTHAVFVYQATLHVPLIIKMPDGTAKRRRIADPISTVDLMPTLLDLLGIEPPQGLAGRSLASRLEGGAEPASPRPLYFESRLPQVEFGWAPLAGLRRGRLKYIEAPRSELYDLEADPNELEPLPTAIREKPLEASLERLRATRWPRGGKEAGHRMTAEEQRKLEALGYLGGGGKTSEGPGADPKDRIQILNLMVEALTHYKAGRLSESERIYREALDRDDRNPVLRKNLAKTLAAEGKLAEAGSLLASAVALADRPALKSDILEILAATELRRGLIEQAAKAAQEAAALDPSSGLAQLQLGRASLAGGDVSRAAAAFDSASRLLRTKAEPLVALAEIRIRQKEPESARMTLEQAIAREPANGRAHYDLGLLALRQRDTGRAKAELETAAELLTAEPDVFSYLAEVCLAQGDFVGAKTALERRLAMCLGDSEATYRLAVLLSREGDLARAEAMLRSLLAAYPAEAAPANGLGTCLARQGRFGEAVAAFRRAVKLDPAKKDYRLNLEQALAAAGNGH